MQPLQTVPSTPAEQLVAPFGGGLHVPTLPPDAIVHVPEQQSVAFAQMSPSWMQNDEPSWQCPPVHSWEQHSPSVVHVLPAVRQTVLSGTQTPLVQVPLQHLELELHAWLSEMHAVVEAHFPALHCRLQQSVATAQLPPAGEHVVVLDAHVSVTPSQMPEQQSDPLPQMAP